MCARIISRITSYFIRLLYSHLHNIINGEESTYRDRICAITFIVCASGFSTGFGFGVALSLSGKKYTYNDIVLTTEEERWLTYTVFITVAATLLLVPWLMSCMGRCSSLIFGQYVKLIASIFYLAANRYVIVLLGRICDAFTWAIFLVGLPIYLAEIVEKKNRGRNVSYIAISIILGLMAGYSIPSFYVTLQIFNLNFNIITTPPLHSLLNTPYYQYSKGQVEKCAKLLSMLRSTEDAQEELTMYGKSIAKKNIFTDRIFLNMIFKVILLSLFGQLTGLILANKHIATILNMTKTYIPLITFLSVQLLAAVSTPFLLDIWGRKPVLRTALLISSVGMLLVGVFFSLKEPYDQLSHSLKALPFIGIGFADFGYVAAYTTLYFVLIPELFDGPSRAWGLSIASLVVTLTTFAFTALSIDIIPLNAVFFVCSVASLLLMVGTVVVPETKKISCGKIQVDLCPVLPTEINA